MLGIFLDIETTGLNPTVHRAIDLAFQVIDLTGCRTVFSYQSMIAQPAEVWDNSDPKSLAINGYSREMTTGDAFPEQVAKEVIAHFQSLGIQRKKAVFICQNPAFDRIYFTHLIDVTIQESLNWPYHWLDLASMYWVKMQQTRGHVPEEILLSKDQIASVYDLPPERAPHNAMRGVQHLIACYQKVMDVQFDLSVQVS